MKTLFNRGTKLTSVQKVVKKLMPYILKCFNQNLMALDQGVLSLISINKFPGELK